MPRQVFWLPRPFSNLPITINRNSGYLRLKGSLHAFWRKSGVTAAGPLPIFTGFPIKLTHLNGPLIKKMTHCVKVIISAVYIRRLGPTTKFTKDTKSIHNLHHQLFILNMLNLRVLRALRGDINKMTGFEIFLLTS